MLNIYGIYAQDGMPVVQLLERVINREHVNHIELARTRFDRERITGRTYDAIMVIVQDDEAFVYVFK